MRLFFTLIFFATASQLFAQTPNLNTVKDAITTLADNFPQEKIYLHYDKPSYAPGETIWFKAYLMSGVNADDISKTVYIDFIDPSGRLLKHCVQAVYQSSASGDFSLPLDYKERTVYVKAYTRWMLNFDSSFLYRKAVQVVQTKPLTKPKNTTEKTAIQFLPEGGDLINDIESKVAFKAVNADGRPANVQGSVVDKSGAQVAEIKTMHDGMGFFLLQPKAGETYTAKWKDAQGNDYQTKLPAAKETGVTLQIALQNNTRGFKIERSANAPDNFKKIYIAATMQQHLVYFAAANLQDNAVTGGAIPVSSLPSGILQVTLFDSNWVAVAERITFVNNDDYHFDPEAGFSELGLDKRKSNTLVISVPDSINANLSVSVTDAGIGIDSSDDIVSRLLLTGDLKGTIYHPHYYFTNTSDTLQQQLDLVMLTNGWRRINWQDVVNNKFPAIKYQNDTAYLTFSGKVFGASETDLRQGAFILMMMQNKKDTTRKVEQATINSNSTFSLPQEILLDTTKVYYKVAGSSELSSTAAVTFNSSMPANKVLPTDTTNAIAFTDTATENYRRRLAEEQARLFKLQQGTTLQDVTVTTKAKSPLEVMDEKYTSGLFSGNFDSYQFDVLNDPFGKTAMSVFTYLQGKVAGLTITTPSGIGNTPSVSWRGGTPTFYLDEMPVDVSQLSTINMSDVAYVKVFRPPFLGSAGGGANGAIAVYTRKGGDVTQRAGKGLPYKVVIGYTVQKEFYSPDYATFDNRNDEQDLRTTLYWNPMILTNQENHTVRLHFYNNDITKSFRVIVEGMTTDGRLTHIEKVIE
jgi:hypothetical protein